MTHHRVITQSSLVRMAFCKGVDSRVCDTFRMWIQLVDPLFPGYVVSDWGATHDSAADNANAGLDMEQPGDYIVIGEYGLITQGIISWLEKNKVAVPSRDSLGLVALRQPSIQAQLRRRWLNVSSPLIPLTGWAQRFDQMVSHILAAWYHLGQDSVSGASNHLMAMGLIGGSSWGISTYKFWCSEAWWLRSSQPARERSQFGTHCARAWDRFSFCCALEKQSNNSRWNTDWNYCPWTTLGSVEN